MSYPFPPYANVAPVGDGSSINSSLLTPPIPPQNEHDVPYRPTDTDQTSLSMKKRGRRLKKRKEPKDREQRQPNLDDGSHDYETSRPQILPVDDSSRCRSVSLLHSTKSRAELSQFSQDDIQKLRRWTLPSKSAPTRSFTPLRSTVKQATLSTEPESPAMITLRRATTNKRPTKVELTFFPEPKFGNDKSGLLSYIISTFSRPEISNSTGQSNRKSSARRRSTRSASVGGDGAHPTLTFPAATVCTETSVESSFAMPGTLVAKAPSRRCSTKYVAGDSCIEIIWDENDDSSVAYESSRPSVVSERRPSMAAMKLEAQLAHGVQDTGRALAQSRKSSSTNSQSSVNMFLEQVMTPEKLASLFPRLIHDTSLRNLPRSVAGRRECNKDDVTATGSACQMMMNDNLGPFDHCVDVLPPLHSRRASTQQTSGPAERRVSVSPDVPKSGSGSMVGCSSHTRRRSSAITAADWRRSSGKQRYSRALGKDGVMGGQMDDADVTPLLSKQAGNS